MDLRSDLVYGEDWTIKLKLRMIARLISHCEQILHVKLDKCLICLIIGLLDIK
jgi:hypothetical protein